MRRRPAAACAASDANFRRLPERISIPRVARRTTVGRSGGALLRAHEFFRRGPASPDGWSQLIAKDRGWETFYRERWQHDKVVRSTHGVNCTGSCSWNVYVKDGLVTWETQAADYPSTGPGMPEYEPRGCPRGASFSWYVYSPIRLRYPYVRGSLIEMYRAERERTGDPVEAWAAIVDDPERRRTYTRQRGRGGFVRAGWDETVELIAAAHVHTIRRYGPDRMAGFTPIPAMSMASYASGTRFLSLIGGVMPELLRLVLRPAAGLAADVRRPDRRAGVGRLVERRLPDRVGDEPADDAHARRTFHDRGPLPRPEGRGGEPRLRGAHQVRRPLAGSPPRYRRRARDGDGACDPAGVLGRP